MEIWAQPFADDAGAASGMTAGHPAVVKVDLPPDNMGMSDQVAPIIAEKADHYTPLKAWWVVTVVMIFQIVSLIDRVIVSVLIPEMRADLHLNDFQISLVQGMAFALFYGTMGLLIGGLVDRYSRRTIMFGAITIWSVAATMTGFARNYSQLFLCRLAVGFGEGAISPAAQSLLSSLFPRHKLSTPMSCFTAAGVAGMSLSFVLGGLLLERFTHHPLGGVLTGLPAWRQVLIVTGLPGLLVGWLAFTVSDRRVRKPALPDQAQGTGDWHHFWSFIRGHKRLVVGMFGGYFFASMATQGMMTWAPSYARRVLGVGAAEVGGVMGIAVGVSGIFGALALGMLIDRLFRKGYRNVALRSFAWMALIIAPLSSLGFVLGNATIMFGCVALMLFTLGSSFGPALAAVQMIAPSDLRGRFGALAVLVANLGGLALGPMFIGVLTDYVYGNPQDVGRAVATALIILGPLASLCMFWASPVFLARVNEQGEH